MILSRQSSPIGWTRYTMKVTLGIIFSITGIESLYKNTRSFSRDFHVLLNIVRLYSIHRPTLLNQN